MNVRILQTFADDKKAYIAGQVINMPLDLARPAIAGELAEPTNEPTPAQLAYSDRLKIGANEPCLFLPVHGLEFGHEILHRVRYIHAHPSPHKIVTCKKGDDCLYPSAAQIIHYVDAVPDNLRAGAGRSIYEHELRAGGKADYQKQHDQIEELVELASRNGWHLVPTGGLTMEMELECRFDCPSLHLEPTRRHGLTADVILGVRYRDFCAEKNWPRQHWQYVADALRSNGFTFGVSGIKPYSYDLDGQQFQTPDTDANVEALQNCRLFISTDCGTSHLAALIGVPSLLFRHPGFHRDFLPVIRECNSQQTTIIDRCWDNPQTVVDKALEILHENTCLCPCL